MKYLIILGDGMADYPVAALQNRTPLEAADKPHMDALAAHGTMGLVRTVPQGMPPGSDTANMSVMGFPPRVYYSGRSPLEAVSLGIDVHPEDVTFRTNLVCLSEEADYTARTMVDFSGGEISTPEAVELIEALQPLFSDADLQLYPGISYRHCLVKRNGSTGTVLTPPHDITGKPIAGHLPAGRYGARLLELMKASADLLENHPVNLARKARGENPANSVWFWGEGTKPKLDPLEQLYGVRGGVVCAVDLIKGLGLCAGMRTVDVPGATGGMVTNYRGKAEAALRLLHDGCDLVYIHIEAPDECGHHGDAAAKVRAIEEIDRNILGWLMEQLDREGEAYRILLTPDHPTPVSLMTHTDEPVTFVIYDSTAPTPDSGCRYTEAAAKAAGLFLPEGPLLMKRLLGRE